MAFPQEQIEGAIRDEIRRAAEDRPVPKGGWEPDVDSHVMVRIVLRIEEDLDINLPDDCMPPGGFDDIEQCVDVVIAQCRQIWLDKQKVEGASVS